MLLGLEMTDINKQMNRQSSDGVFDILCFLFYSQERDKKIKII